jgi:hypothetical protein
MNYMKSLELTYVHSVIYLDAKLSRIPPACYYYIFITCDVVSLSLQGTGGGMSSSSSGSSNLGADIAIAGLCSQVFSLTVFSCLAADYAFRYWRGHKGKMATEGRITKQFSVFVGFLTFAVICILIRCVYRIDELSKGYTTGTLIHNQALFIALEGAWVYLSLLIRFLLLRLGILLIILDCRMVLLAVFALNVAHPGPVFAGQQKKAILDPEVKVGHVEGDELSGV